MSNYKITIEAPKAYNLFHPDGELLGTFESEEDALKARAEYEADDILKENDNE